MRTTDKMKKEIENTASKEKTKDITPDNIDNAGVILSDEDLDNASGGDSYFWITDGYST